ncbi:FAD:protein FMN transferase [Phragmitibacter flavus]|uniref:FAD:protein FMN transferase n=1 Tax=Phragmitibacter flavus TaxID=2576071 RepID=A0A5R8K9Q2_9BACT|nr:FAD:protein FMN transferase [Phragmitibacter flavus]TLD69043.1 FAD:protein FMN transferase [Phragmitibacter flavus]
MHSQRQRLPNHFITLVGITLLFVLGAHSPVHALEYFQRNHAAMGTQFHFHVHAESAQVANTALDEAISLIEAINQIASDYLPESELSRLNRAPAHQPIPLSDDLHALLTRSIEISALTEGAFDITAAYAVQNWRRARRQQQLPKPELTAKAISMTNWRALEINHHQRTLTKTQPEILIDLGGIAKGYAADAALTILRQHGITRALVAASGDLAIGDPPPGKSGWPVTLRSFAAKDSPSPDVTSEILLHNCACSTSGDLHQYLELDGKRWSHIVDPATGLGLTRRIAATLIAPDSTTADALATAACILGPQKALQLLQDRPGISFRITELDEAHPHRPHLTISGPAFKPTAQ